MSAKDASSDSIRGGVYVGAAVVGVSLLVPYVKLVFFVAFLVGPMAGAWVLRRSRRTLDRNGAAKLGFYCAFYGMIAAIAIHRVLTRVIEDELLQFENLYRLPPLLADMGLNTDSAEDWYLWMFKVSVIAIGAGAIGAPLGLLAARVVHADGTSKSGEAAPS